MTRVVGIDTSTWWGGVALVEGDDPETASTAACCGVQVADSHAAHLVAWLERLLEQTGWPRDSIDAYACARGPGSFTGLRIGMATIRGLALGAGRPAIGVSTLAAMAEAHGDDELRRRPVVGAGRRDVYTACYEPTGSPPPELEAPAVVPWPLFAERAASDRAIGAGELELDLGSGERELTATGYPAATAAAVARLALPLVASTDDVAGHAMAPLYLRPPDAELKAGPGR